MNTCGCGTAYKWRRHVDSGRRAPVETTPDPDGNVVIEGGGYRVLTDEEKATKVGPRFVLHFGCDQFAATMKRRDPVHHREKGAAR